MTQATLAGVTTENIQQCLDENKQLILAILQLRNMNIGIETTEHEARLQRNLEYLAAVADIQSHVEATTTQPPPSAAAAQPSPVAQPHSAEQWTSQPMQYQQLQHRVPQSIAVPPPFLYSQQQQQHQHQLHQHQLQQQLLFLYYQQQQQGQQQQQSLQQRHTQQQHQLQQQLLFLYYQQQQQDQQQAQQQQQAPPQATMYSQLMADPEANSEFSMLNADGPQARRSAAESELHQFFKDGEIETK